MYRFIDKLLRRLKRIVPTFLLSLFAFSTLSMAGPVKVEFEVSKQKAKEGMITLKVVNTSDKVLKVLSWNTALEKTISANIFNVKYGKKTMTYLGRMVKRGTPTENDYITLQEGESRKVEIDLAKYYDMPEAGKYSITYSGQFKLKNNKAHKNVLHKANSTTAYIYYNPAEKKTVETRVKTTNYNGCTSAESSVVSDAHSAAISISLDAKNAMAQANPNIRQERYVVWFGEPDSSRQNTMKTHFNNIYGDLNTQNIIFDCTCTDDYYAYVYPSDPYKIYLCNAFWSADMTGTDSKAGTIVHEMSHFTVVAGTDDHVYGQSGAQSLAESNPNDAIDNADNHEYFAENTPTLSMDTILTDPFDNAIVINDLVFDTPITETIVSADDSDIYTFIAPQTGSYTFYTTDDLDTIGTLYNSVHTALASNDDVDLGGGNYNFSITANLTQGETYFLRVESYGSNVGGYTLHVDYDISKRFAFLIPVYHMLLQ